jgi:leucyl aminopeptidase
MMLQFHTGKLDQIKTDALVIPVCEDGEIHKNPLVKKLIARIQKHKAFKGAKGDEALFYDSPLSAAGQVILLGMGTAEKIDAEMLRKTAGHAVKAGRRMGLKKIVIIVPSSREFNLKTMSLLTSLFEGAYLGNHIFHRYKAEVKENPVKRIGFWVTPSTARKFKSLPALVSNVCEGTILAREWVSTPSNDKTPAKLAGSILTKARKVNLKVRDLKEAELKRQKFGALLAVSMGSQNKPRMVVLQYSPRGAKKTVALIGKGVTFDSGGINLKPSSGMDTMKMDMAGAAAVAATLITAALIKPRVNIVGLLPMVENMPSGKATRPGDIIKTYQGKTVEIGNTDAEGRLILVDAISYAVKKYRPDMIIDLATLTGACVVALGEKIAGVFSTDADLGKNLVASGENTGEHCWTMPLHDDYRELLKSKFADLNNMPASRYGGAITAALFLSEFVGETPWAHIDIAGPAYSKKESDYCGAGGTGFGVRLLIDWLQQQ